MYLLNSSGIPGKINQGIVGGWLLAYKVQWVNNLISDSALNGKSYTITLPTSFVSTPYIALLSDTYGVIGEYAGTSEGARITAITRTAVIVGSQWNKDTEQWLRIIAMGF